MTQVDVLTRSIDIISHIMGLPSTRFKPELNRAHNHWEATYGDLIGVGSTPKLAMENFDSKFEASE